MMSIASTWYTGTTCWRSSRHNYRQPAQRGACSASVVVPAQATTVVPNNCGSVDVLERRLIRRTCARGSRGLRRAAGLKLEYYHNRPAGSCNRNAATVPVGVSITHRERILRAPIKRENRPWTLLIMRLFGAGNYQYGHGPSTTSGCGCRCFIIRAGRCVRRCR